MGNMDLTDIQQGLKVLGAKRSEILVLIAIVRAGRPLRFSEILETTGLSDRTVRMALRSLRDSGYIRVEGRGRATRYVTEKPGVVAELIRKRVEEKISTILTHLLSRL